MLQAFDEITHESLSAFEASLCSHHDPHLKLPTFKVLPFSGDPGKWLEFRDAILTHR